MRIGSIELDRKVLVVAEIGNNHEGNIGVARDLVRKAAECGADAVKFQNYKTEDFLSSRALTHEYISQGKTVVAEDSSSAEGLLPTRMSALALRSLVAVPLMVEGELFGILLTGRKAANAFSS